jgi:hypothetical protein
VRGESEARDHGHGGGRGSLQGPGVPGGSDLDSVGPPEYRLFESILRKDKFRRLEATND